MNWGDLEAFLAVYRHGSYAAAGRALRVNATTIARRIDRLGHDVGAVLFQVSNDGLVATAAAEAIEPAAVAMERQATLIERRLSGDEARLAGSVRIATTAEFVSHFLVDHVPKLHARHPKLELHFMVANQFANVGRGDVDLAVRFTTPDGGVPLATGESPDAVVGRVLGPTAVDLVASREYLERRGNPGPDGDLSGHALVMQPAPYYLPGMTYLAEHEDEATAVFRCDSLATLIAAADQGLGLAAVPSYFATRYENLVVVRPRIAERTAWLLMARDLRRVARVRVVRDFIVDLFLRWGGAWAGDETAIPAGA